MVSVAGMFPVDLFVFKGFFLAKSHKSRREKNQLKIDSGRAWEQIYKAILACRRHQVFLGANTQKKKETVASPQGNEGCSPCLLPNPTSCRSAKLDPTGQWDTEKTGSTRQGQVANNTLMFLLVYFKGIEGCSGTICPRLDSSSRSTKNWEKVTSQSFTSLAAKDHGVTKMTDFR